MQRKTSNMVEQNCSSPESGKGINRRTSDQGRGRGEPQSEGPANRGRGVDGTAPVDASVRQDQQQHIMKRGEGEEGGGRVGQKKPKEINASDGMRK